MGVKKFLVLAAVVLSAVASATGALTTNSWTAAGSGFWQTAGNWSAGVPADTQAVVLVTNAATKVVTINSATAAGSLTISNLTVRGFGAGVNTLQLTNAPANTLVIRNQLTVGTNAVLIVTNANLEVQGLGGGTFNVDGAVSFERGTIMANNASVNLSIGNVHSASVTMKNGLMLNYRVIAGSGAGNPGTFTVAGGTNSVATLFDIAFAANSTGAVWVTGGRLEVTGGRLDVGSGGSGTMTISNGVVQLPHQNVGASGRGTFTVAGGSDVVSENLDVAQFAGSTGTVWMSGGTIQVTSNITIGVDGNGQWTSSNGTLQAQTVIVASNSAHGTWTIVGGTNVIDHRLIVASAASTTGMVNMIGGQLIQTNGSLISAIGLGNRGVGTMTFSGGSTRMHELSVGNGPGARGRALFTGGTNEFAGFIVGQGSAATGDVFVTGGRFLVTNTPALTQIGQFGVGQMTISNGVVLLGSLNIGLLAGGNGTLTIAGGTNAMTGPLNLGNGGVSRGTLWLTGGELIVTNAPANVTTGGGGLIIDGAAMVATNCSIILSNSLPISVGVHSSGSLTVEGGSLLFPTLGIGIGAQGTLTVDGGTLQTDNLTPGVAVLVLGNSGGGTGAAWVANGQIILTNHLVLVGFKGGGDMTMSNGTVRARGLNIGISGGSGELTMAGGTANVSSNLLIGDAGCLSDGLLTINAGNLNVTNTAHTAVLDIESGTLIQTGGTLIMDNLIITNACAHYIKTGGSFSILTTIAFDANGDADDDGMPNQYEVDNGLLLFDPRDAAQDKDGDGQSNLAEFLAGTSPTNSASFFGITAIVRTNNNIRVTWKTVASKTNALERSLGVAGSFSTNTFSVLTNIITTGTTTNYLDVGAATNATLYYRVRLVP